jgi:transposase InsO family protein
MNRIQMDIVDMMRNPVERSEDKVFRYVLVVLDVFSRFIFLRPLQSKSSTEVAAVVMQIFSDVGPPKIIQTDQGTEFKGVVEQVMNKLKVKIIHSRPYHSQSQGKIERSHRTWKSFMKFDALTGYEAFLDQHEGCDWVAGLPVYQHLYNTTHHTSIG